MALRNDLGRLAAAYRAGQNLALLFDYDGVLAPPVTHPALAHCPTSTAQLLAQFADLPRVGVGVLSNRTIDDLKSRVRMPKLSYVGTSGLEVEAKNLAIIHPRAQHYRPYLEHALQTLSAVVAAFEGAWLEDKTLALTVHTCAVKREDRPLLQKCLSTALQRYDGLLIAVHGSAAAEIRPDIGWATGDTVRQILESHDGPALALYAGSYASDAVAFGITTQLGGVTIGVGPSAPANAMHQLPDSENLTAELMSFFRLLSDRPWVAAQVN